MWKKIVVDGGCIGWLRSSDAGQSAIEGCSNPVGTNSKYCSKKCRVANAHARAKARKRKLKGGA